MVLAALDVVVALLLGSAAAREFYFLGVESGLRQPLWVGLVGMAVSLVLGLAGIARWRRWATARRIALLAGALLIVFHVYGALPPHRNVGILGAIVGVGYGVLTAAAAGRGRGASPSARGSAAA